MYSVGVDEVGRGCVFGNVVAAAVILPDSFPDDTYLKIRDSKKVGKKEREMLDAYIRQHAIAYGVGESSVEEVDEYNILQATFTAMHRACNKVYEKVSFTSICVDGTMFRPYVSPDGKTIEATCIIGGDASNRSIAAASILAKVHRDRQMMQLVAESPRLKEYGIHTNMGYGTPAHLKALKEYGITPHHRKSFAPVRNML